MQSDYQGMQLVEGRASETQDAWVPYSCGACTPLMAALLVTTQIFPHFSSGDNYHQDRSRMQISPVETITGLPTLPDTMEMKKVLALDRLYSKFEIV